MTQLHIVIYYYFVNVFPVKIEFVYCIYFNIRTSICFYTFKFFVLLYSINNNIFSLQTHLTRKHVGEVQPRAHPSPGHKRNTVPRVSPPSSFPRGRSEDLSNGQNQLQSWKESEHSRRYPHTQLHTR